MNTTPTTSLFVTCTHENDLPKHKCRVRIFINLLRESHKTHCLLDICLTMNSRTRPSSNAGNNSSSTNKKRKLITENNIRQSTEGSKTTSDIIGNIGMNGKTTDKDEYETNSNISGYDD